MHFLHPEKLLQDSDGFNIFALHRRNKIKKSVTDSASFEIGIKIGLRPFSGTKSEAIQVHSNIIDPLKVSLSIAICLPLANSCERFAQGGGVLP